jgi:ribosomal protein S19E (S16A)
VRHTNHCLVQLQKWYGGSYRCCERKHFRKASASVIRSVEKWRTPGF